MYVNSLVHIEDEPKTTPKFEAIGSKDDPGRDLFLLT